jgi:hypothetical protein
MLGIQRALIGARRCLVAPCSSCLADFAVVTDAKAGACNHFRKAFSQYKNAVRCTSRNVIIHRTKVQPVLRWGMVGEKRIPLRPIDTADQIGDF